MSRQRVAADLAASWRKRAACRGEPTILWYPGRGKMSAKADEVCAGCPVADPCLEYGFGERHGIWGRWRHSERRAELEADDELCEGCGRVLEPGRHRWCSEECTDLVAAAGEWAAEQESGEWWQMQMPFAMPEQVSAPLGGSLARIRKDRGETTAAAAGRVGVSEARWCGWEEGRPIEEENVEPLAAWFHVPPDRVREVAGLPVRDKPDPCSSRRHVRTEVGQVVRLFTVEGESG